MSKGKPIDLPVATVVAYFRDTPGASIHEAAAHFGCHHATVYLRIKKGLEDGLLAKTNKRRSIRAVGQP